MNELQRLDRWLWFARFFKSRTLASKACSGSKIRLNRQIVNKASVGIRIGDVLTFSKGSRTMVVRIVDLGTRRGPAPEARLLYDDLSPAAPGSGEPGGSDAVLATRNPGSGRPTKQDRRAIERFTANDGT